MQAGGVGNDSIAVVYLLASLHFGLISMEERRLSPVFLAVISASLLTACKASNLPLLLPCAIPLLYGWKTWIKKVNVILPMLLLGACVSFLPLAILNLRHTGDWTGDPGNTGRLKIEAPIAGIVGNTLQLGVSLIQPPLQIMKQPWEQIERFAEKNSYLNKHFPRISLRTQEIPNEETAGLGLALLLVFLVFISTRGKHTKSSGLNRLGYVIWLSSLFSLLVFMAKMGSENGPRLLAPYYPIVLSGFCAWAGSPRTKSGTFPAFIAVCAMLAPIPPLILTPSRPLLPMQRLTATLLEKKPDSAALSRMKMVYSTYARRWDVLGPLREGLDAFDVEEVGFMGSGDDSEVALWRPFGSRKVVLPSQEYLPDIIVAREDVHLLNENGESLLKDYEVLQTTRIISKVQEGPVEWSIMTQVKGK